MTNNWNSFKSTTTVSTGLSDFHKMIVTVLKTTFPKNKPKVILYRDFSKFGKEHFREALRAELQKTKVISYENLYLMVINIHAPIKKENYLSKP